MKDYIATHPGRWGREWRVYARWAMLMALACAIGTSSSSGRAADTPWTRLDFLPGSLGPAAARTINERGEVAGFSFAVNGATFHAAVWSKDGVIDLPPPSGYTASEALGMNNRGQVVGVALRPGSYAVRTAVLWQNGTATILPSLPDRVGNIARAINDMGQIVGSSSTLR